MFAIMNVEEFPTLPQIITKIIDACEDEQVTVDDLAKIISNDPSICARILKLANSAYYGYLRKVNTISKAITILGFETIKTLSISASVFDSFKKIRSNYNFNRCQFWLHSIGTATICKVICRHIHNHDVEVVFLVGLLHDIGKLFFESYYEPQFEEVMKLVTVNRCSIYDAESQVFGVTHDEVGGWLTERWKFPLDLVNPIQYHHDVKSCPEEYAQFAAMVQVADHICRIHNIGSGGDNLIPQIDPAALEILGLTMQDVDDISNKVTDEKENIFTFMAIMD
jgi:putative nucleotidyltransferase with HDIG domain